MKVGTRALEIFTALASPAQRPEAITKLAQLLGARDVIIFVWDSEVESYLPAPGFQQVLPGRRKWKRFLEECAKEGTCSAEVDYRGGVSRISGVLAPDGSIMAVVGGRPDSRLSMEAARYLPLLARVLLAERAAQAAEEHARAARESALQLSSLAQALDSTRLELQVAVQAEADARQQLQDELAHRRRIQEQLKQLNETLESRVKQRTAELQKLNDQLRQEIEVRLEAENAARRANQALRQSNQNLEEFAYAASHDLQEPLRKIIAFSDLLRKRLLPRLSQSEESYFNRMINAASRMSRLIEDLLTLSRVSTRRSPFQPVDLNQLLESVLSDLEVRIAEVEGRVESEKLPSIEADPSQLRRLLQNLIGNALKFHRPGVPPRVKVWATLEEDKGEPRCRLMVEDNGIGFSEDELEKVFAPFQRLHGRSEKFEGSGMGLAICQRIVKRHHGRLTARSTPGKGSVFTAVLPLRQPSQE